MPEHLRHDLFSNVAAYMWACRYGIALLEDRVGRGVNGNVLIELGAMVMAGRRTAVPATEGSHHRKVADGRPSASVPSFAAASTDSYR
jgi:hypothetical protein